MRPRSEVPPHGLAHRPGFMARPAQGGPFPAELRRFLQQRFSAEASRIEARWAQRFDAEFELAGQVPARHEEYADLLALLLEHASDISPAIHAIAHWIAYSCMGNDHLWEDLGLPERPALSRLMEDCFPGLFRLNSRNMRWKRFFYKQLCERAEVSACRSPSCDACTEYSVCFAPQEGAA